MGVILAAGRGSRMGALTNDRPKCFLKIGDERLIDLQLSAMKAAGIAKVAIVTGYMKKEFFGIGDKQFHNPEWQTTQMFHSLQFASEWLEKYPCVISYSDIFYSETIVKRLMQTSENLCLAYDKKWLDLWTKRFTDPLSDAESFKVDANQNLIEIGQKVSSTKEIFGQYMGLIKVTPKGWGAIRNETKYINAETLKKIQITQLLSMLLRSKSLKIKCVENFDNWGEVDNVNDLNLYNSSQITKSR